jgi:V-type H+-transporting ATPase subunit e
VSAWADSCVCSVWRSSLCLAFASCYIMWGMSPSARESCCEMIANECTAITLLAQLHPLIVPRRSDLRPESPEKMMLF